MSSSIGRDDLLREREADEDRMGININENNERSGPKLFLGNLQYWLRRKWRAMSSVRVLAKK